MEVLKGILEYQNKIWGIVVGIAFIVFGIYQYIDITNLEQAGQMVRLKRVFQYVYDYGGKYAILGIFEASGILVLISSILRLKTTD